MRKKMPCNYEKLRYCFLHKIGHFCVERRSCQANKEAIGEDFMEFLDYNPLQNSIDVYMNADFVSSEKVEEIATQLSENNLVDEVSYDKPLISLLNNNLKKISFWVLVVSALFTFIAVLLINSSFDICIFQKVYY